MASWNCHEHHHSGPADVDGACDSGCVPPSMCAGVQPRYRCVVPAAGGAAWTVEDPASSPHPVPGPCRQVFAAVGAPYCPQRHVKVHSASYLDDSDAAYCRTSRFPTSVSVDTSSCCTSATSQEPWSNLGMSRGRHEHYITKRN